ncbi:unnamed protein product [Pleuronectes platessa]|uniref:Uncharacterized protein n=1 Tax=Pleuronectes platessa TaxID=8262 RepID=A0A9N7VP68_PLEPL|nr:unnamed protein product [Pleuronectes platessa]
MRRANNRGISCQIHRSRAVDRGAGPGRTDRGRMSGGVDRGPDCPPASNAGPKDSMHSSAEHTGPTVARDASFVQVSAANAASQHGSPPGLTGDADPMKGD